MLMIGIAYLAMNMENNDSRLMNIPKHEFTRVLGDIMNGTTTPMSNSNSSTSGGSNNQKVQRNVEGIYPGNIDRRNTSSNNRGIVTPRSAAIQKAIELEQKKSKKYYDRVKHDSFYFLQKSIMKRKDGKEGYDGFDTSNLTDDEDLNTPRSNDTTPRGYISKIF